MNVGGLGSMEKGGPPPDAMAAISANFLQVPLGYAPAGTSVHKEHEPMAGGGGGGGGTHPYFGYWLAVNAV